MSDSAVKQEEGSEPVQKEIKMNRVDEGRSQTQFPPPCSWYQSHLADGRNDMWAYSSLNGVVVVRPGGSGPASSVQVKSESESNENEKEILKPTCIKAWPEFTFLEIPQGAKVASVSFCKAPWSALPLEDSPLVSACEGGVVRIWNLKTQSTAMYNEIHKGNGAALVEWSPRDPNLIYTMDILGNLSVWNVKKHNLNAMNFGKTSPTCIAVSPHDDNIVAIGTKPGHIMIVEAIGLGKILNKMRHEEEVFRISWKPTGNWGAVQDKVSHKKPYLISSIASIKPPSIRVWDSHGKDVAIIRPWEKDTKDRKLFKSFVPSSWAVDPNSGELILISSGQLGEIIGWSESSTRPDVIHDLHFNYTIFAIVQCGDILWSLSHEPVIIGWNMRENRVECVIPTFKGVSSIVSSPIESSRLAIGGMDGCIRILSVGNGYPEVSPMKPPTVTSRLKGKITSLTWHPYRDNLVGFGTDEGVIGVYEWKSDNKFAMMFDRRVNGTVYTVDFGPSTTTEDYVPRTPADAKVGSADDSSTEKEPAKSNLMLYACGGHSVFMIHPSRQSNPLINVSKIICRSNMSTKKMHKVSESVSEIKWTPDLSYFAVGYNDGRIEIYSPPFLRMRCWISCHGRGIQFFSWRMQDFARDSESQCRWFASASNDGTARLFNLAQLFSKEFKENTEAEPFQLISSIATLNGHGGMRVICLAWSPHDPNLLVTVSYDRTAVVWNTTDGSQIARYHGHQHRLVTCMFHPLDKYKVITASDEIGLDFSIHVWDYRHYPASKDTKKYKLVDLLPPKAEPIKVQLTHGRVIGPEGHDVGVGSLPDRNIVFVQAKSGEKSRSKSKAKSILPTTSNALINAKHSFNEELRYIVDKTPIPEKKDVTSAQQISEERATPKKIDCEGETSEVENGIPDSSVEDSLETEQSPTLHLGVLGSTEDAHQLISAERDFHATNENWDYAAQLGNWLGDPVKTIEEAMKSGHLTETMVAMTATYSKKLYYEAVQALAAQFYDRDDHYKAVTYLLLIDKVEEAVEILVKKKLYREATLLAKSRFPEELPLVTEIQERWVVQLVTEGNFELACKINCSLGRYSEGLSNIEKRNTPYAWKGALYLAVKAGELKKAEGFGVKYLEDRMSNREYAECIQMMTEFGFLKWMMPIVLVHESLTEIGSKDVPLENNEDVLTDVVSTFGDRIKGKWKSSGVRTEDPMYLANIKNLLQLAIPQNSKEAVLIIAKNITLMLMDEGKEINQLVEDCDKLSNMWLQKEKSHQIIGQAAIAFVRKLSSSS